MPRFALNPKFTYSQASADIFSLPAGSTVSGNGDIDWGVTSPVYAPVMNLPTLGNGHSYRKGQRITVTSIRWKAILSLNSIFRFDSTPFNGQTYGNPLNQGNMVHRFFKFRYMVVKFDTDWQITEDEIHKWFKRSFCWYRDNLDTSGDVENEPVSVHSNIMRMTTPYVSKFNILADRCFTMSTSHPQLSIDVTFPLQQTYVFDEDTQLLIAPNIWLFILAPMARVDMDIASYQQWSNPGSNPVVATPLLHVDSFVKLNFIDL